MMKRLIREAIKQGTAPVADRFIMYITGSTDIDEVACQDRKAGSGCQGGILPMDR